MARWSPEQVSRMTLIHDRPKEANGRIEPSD
jgi:hypothetical protein